MYFNSLNKEYLQLFKRIKFPRYRLSKLGSDYFSSVFICGGGDRNKYNSRAVLGDVFRKNKVLKIIVCEDLQKLMGNLNLLVFEKILADISTMILIPIESYGTACELGAFTYLIAEDNKVVAIINDKFADDKSFIVKGPIAVLKAIGNDRVIKAKYENDTIFMNDEIGNLINHPLLKTSECSKYIFKKSEDNDRTIIIDNYYAFFVFILDFCCFFKRINASIVIDYIKTIYNVDTINTKESKKEKEAIDVIKCMIELLSEFGYVKEDNGDFFNLNREYEKIGLYPEKYVCGKILFTNDEKDRNLIKLITKASLLSELNGKYK